MIENEKKFSSQLDRVERANAQLLEQGAEQMRSFEKAIETKTAEAKLEQQREIETLKLAQTEQLRLLSLEIESLK